MTIRAESLGRKAIKIIPTGWANIKSIISIRDDEYIVPYSSHSNFEEIQKFVCALKPSVIKAVVREKSSNYTKVNGFGGSFAAA